MSMLKRIADIFRIDLDTTGRTFGLDVMRAVGILMVMEEHSFHIIADFVPRGFTLIPYMDKICFFFVLSGFLIGNIIMNLYNRSPDFALFVYTRWFCVPVAGVCVLPKLLLPGN